MASYSFKSVGKTKEIIKDEEIEKVSLPVGIKTPLRSTDKRVFDVHFDLADQISDNLRNLILTNWGERVCLYKFGGNLRPLLTEFVSADDFDTNAISRIKQAVTTWMPFVELEDYQSSIESNTSHKLGAVKIAITYNIPALSVNKKSIEITLNVMLKCQKIY